MNQIKAGALLSYVSILVNIFVSLLYTPIMLRLLGQLEFGLYSLIGSLAAYLSILDMGLGNAIVRYTARNRALGDKEAESKLNGMFVVIYGFIGILTVVIGLILYFNIEHMFNSTLTRNELEKAKIMMILLIVNFAFSFPLGIFGSIMQAYEKFIVLRLITIFRTILNPCIILPFLYFGYTSVTMVVVNTVLNISCLLIHLLYCLRVLKIKMQFRKHDLVLLREISGYSFFIFLGVIVDKVYWSTGQFILGAVSGTKMVAIYAVAMQLNTMYMMFSTSISGVLLPRISIMVARNASNDDFTDYMIKIGRLQYIVMAYIISGFILFGQTFINIWAGLEYSDAYYILLLVMIPITVPLIQNVGILILQAKNLHGFRSVTFIFISIFNIVLSIPLAKVWGGYGCALATSASLIIGNIIIMNDYYRRKIKINIPLFWKNILFMSFPVMITLILGWGINVVIIKNSLLFLLLKITLFTIFYAYSMWRIGLNINERNLFFLPVKKFVKKITNTIQ